MVGTGARGNWPGIIFWVRAISECIYIEYTRGDVIILVIRTVFLVPAVSRLRVWRFGCRGLCVFVSLQAAGSMGRLSRFRVGMANIEPHTLNPNPKDDALRAQSPNPKPQTLNFNPKLKSKPSP